MSTGVACPACQKALPESVLKGPAQAVVRCDGCSTLLLWSHGKVVRSARSNPSTLQGMPVQKGAPPAPPAPPATTPRPVAKTLMGIPTPPPPATEEHALDEKDLVSARPPPPTPAKAPAKPKPEPLKAKASPPTAKTIEAKAPEIKAPVVPTTGPNEVLKAPVVPTTGPNEVLKAPVVPTTGPNEVLKAPEVKAPEVKAHIAAAIAQTPRAVPGPMEDPSEWFGDTQVRDSGDDEPTNVGPAPGPDPLPPLEPEPTNLTARKPESVPAMRRPKSAEIKVEPPKAESAKTKLELPKAEPPRPAASSLFAQSTEPVAPQKTKMAQAPTMQAPAPTMQAPAPVLPKSEPPKKAKDPSPLPLPPSLSGPPKTSHPKATPTPLGSVEPVLDLAPDRRRPPVVYAAIAAAGALVLVVGLIFAFSGGKPKTPEVAVVEKPPPVVEKPPPVVEKPAPPVEKPPPVVAEKPAPPVEKPPPVVAEKPALVAQLDPPVAKPARVRQPPSEEPAPPPRRRSRTLGGKKVVLDEPAAPAAPAKDDPAQVERAREAYKKGNERLFAGNSAGAVAAYKESLSIYPGYVAGYRGLGLAYAQEGNTSEALKALRTYVKTAPTAHDVPLIMKRIERLEKNPQD